MINEPSITAALTALEDQRYAAMRRGDLLTFERLADPELIYVHSNGIRDTLNSYLHKCRDGLYVYHRIEHRIHEVRCSGDTALVFGEMAADITSHGIAKSIHNRTLTVWRRTAAQWRLFAYQPTPMTIPSAL
ncbi:nuclear transport factor 2 family protein [Pseudomonas sp. AIG]